VEKIEFEKEEEKNSKKFQEMTREREKERDRVMQKHLTEWKEDILPNWEEKFNKEKTKMFFLLFFFVMCFICVN
jgi:hypothetical protein